MMQLDAADEILLVAGHPPMRVQKLRYFTDPHFQARVLPAPDLTTPDVPPRAPSPWETEGPKACLPAARARRRRAVDEALEEEGQGLDHDASVLDGAATEE